MAGDIRTLIVAGVVGVGGLLCGADRAEAQAFGPGTNFSLNLGISNGYGPGYGYGPGGGYGPGFGYGRGPGYGHGYGRGHGPGFGPPACAPGDFRPGPGFGHGRGRSYYSETTVITTVVTCDRCGRKHDGHRGCGGPQHGGYRPSPFPPRHAPW